MYPEERVEIVRRLSSAEGHLRAVIYIMESVLPCEQLLRQLGPVRTALRAAGARLVDLKIRCPE